MSWNYYNKKVVYFTHILLNNEQISLQPLALAKRFEPAAVDILFMSGHMAIMQFTLYSIFDLSSCALFLASH